MQPIEDEVDAEDKNDSSEEEAESEESEEGSAEVEDAANICADISGVWCSAKGDAKLVIIQVGVCSFSYYRVPAAFP